MLGDANLGERGLAARPPEKLRRTVSKLAARSKRKEKGCQSRVWNCR